jgi:hypothetical protein
MPSVHGLHEPGQPPPPVLDEVLAPEEPVPPVHIIPLVHV